MTSFAQALLFLAIYVAAILLTALVAFLVRRSLPPRLVLVFALAPLLFVGRGSFTAFTKETILPVDHAMLVPPWNTHPEGGRYNPYANDIALQILPWCKAVRQAWAHGSVPLRNRWNGCGTPLAANGQSSAFSPLMLLTGPLPLAAALALMAALKLFLAFSGMWLWLRELRLASPAALFGAVAFSFSFTVLPWLFSPLTAVVCLWPWLLFAVELLRDRDAGRRAFWLLVAVLSALPLGGHLESAASGCLFTALWIAARRAVGDLPEFSKIALRIAVAAPLAIGLTAFSLVPQRLAILSSNRIVLAHWPFWSSVLSWRPHWPGWPAGAFTTLLPHALGNLIDAPVVAGAVASFPEMALGYIGAAGWASAFLLIRPGSRRRRTEWVLLGLALCGFGIATAAWPFREIAGAVPLLKSVFPVRFLSWIALAGAALAALELERLVGDLRDSKKAVLGALAAAAVLALAMAGVHEHLSPLHAATGGLRFERNALWFSEAGVAAFAIAVGLAAWKRGRLLTALPLELALLAGAELWIQGAHLYRTVRVDQLFPPTPLLQFLQRQAPSFRVVGEGGVLFPNSNVFAVLEDVRTHDPVERRDYVEFLDATCGYPPADYFKQIVNINASALDFLNVRYLVSKPGRASPAEKWRLVYGGEDGTVFENRDVLPRVFAPDKITLVAGVEKRLGWNRNAFAAFGVHASAIAGKRDWREHAFVLGREAKVIVNGQARITEYRESTNEASFRVRVSGEAAEAFLVASLTQDGGWSARDESGRRIDATLANGPFLALRVPSGDHLIFLRYSPPGFRTGAGVTAACLLAVAVGPSRRAASRIITRFSSPWLARLEGSRRVLRNPWIWLGGATAVLIAGLSTSRIPSSRLLLTIPATPLDLTNVRLARLWNFLAEVRDKVPEGASFTLLAADPDDQMSLYMLSLGVLDKQVALPSYYWGGAMPQGGQARYVLSYGGALPGTEGALLVFRARDGAVYARPANHP